MRSNVTRIAASPLVRLAAIATAALALSGGPTRVWADGRNGVLHITKNCQEFTGIGGYCTITASNVPQIPAGSTVYYTAGIVQTNLLDSNAVLYVGAGDWATGRCTLDLPSATGLCTFSDGVGQLAGFTARITVSPYPDGVNYHWDGTYSFAGRGD
jgi:hypothetical protein